MIELKSDGFILVYENKDLKLKRTLSIDKLSGRVRITEFDINTNEVINDIKCDVFELDSINNIEKYAQEME